MRKGTELIYLHSDVLGSVALATNVNNGTVDSEQYYAYGRDRGAGTLPTDHNFTGQKKDATGLLYFNARYYDPALGTFISPDTLVPDPTHVFDYNRYMAFRGNPLKYTDPSGHCPAPPASGDQAAAAEYNKCWNLVNTILQQWNKTGYWDRVWDKAAFEKYVAPDPNLGSAFFAQHLAHYHKSAEYKAWEAQLPQRPVSAERLADPMCAGDPACQALVQFVECEQVDCVGITNDVVGVGGAALIVASPLCGPAAPGCAAAGGYLSTSSTIVGVGWTLNSWANGRASDADLLVMIDTTIAGARAKDPRAGLVVNIVQLAWDAWGSGYVRSRME